MHDACHENVNFPKFEKQNSSQMKIETRSGGFSLDFGRMALIFPDIKGSL